MNGIINIVQINNSVCPKCRTQFECGIIAGNTTCWCFLSPSQSVVDDSKGCYCPECLKTITTPEFKQPKIETV